MLATADVLTGYIIQIFKHPIAKGSQYPAFLHWTAGYIRVKSNTADVGRLSHIWSLDSQNWTFCQWIQCLYMSYKPGTAPLCLAHWHAQEWDLKGFSTALGCWFILVWCYSTDFHEAKLNYIYQIHLIFSPCFLPSGLMYCVWKQTVRIRCIC